MSYPKISIITITFNAEKTLEQAIQSVLNQDYDNVEFVLVDGGSTDGTLNIIQKYTDDIDVMLSEPDRGISDAFNKGIRLSGGDLIFILSADDYFYDNKVLSNIADYYSKNSDVDVIHGNVIMLDDKVGTSVISKPDSSLKSCYFGQPLKHGGTFITQYAYKKYGLFCEDYKYAMDYDLILRYIVQGARFRYVDDSIAVIRCGGVNQQYREKTIDECLTISVKHGVPMWKAQLFKKWKKQKDRIKNFLQSNKLSFIIGVYRYCKNKDRGL